MATHIVSTNPTIYQTTNPIVPPRAGTVIAVARMERAVLTVDSKEALRELYGDAGLGPLQGAGKLEGAPDVAKIWVCGSYAYEGIPLLEGCVASARLVVRRGVLASEEIVR